MVENQSSTDRADAPTGSPLGATTRPYTEEAAAATGVQTAARTTMKRIVANGLMQSVQRVGMLCVPLWIDERGLGALSLYADQTAAFSEPHERVTILLATLAALALAEAQRADQMHDALGHRDVIGQAKGILMERHGVTADAAFSVLSRVSQAEKIKLADVARRFVATREFPRVPDPENADAMP